MTRTASDAVKEDRPTRLRLRVSRVAESVIRGGHPWVYSDSVRESNRQGRVGELAVIYDRNDRFLAIGLFDPDSPIQVRILHQGKACTIDENWFQQNLHRALDARAGLFGLHSPGGPSPNPLPEGEGDRTAAQSSGESPTINQPNVSDGSLSWGRGLGEGEQSHTGDVRSSDTTGYRLINGESDGWPALVLDRYDTTQVLKLYSLAWLQRLELLQSLFISALRPERIVLRLSRNIQDEANSDFKRTDGEILFGPQIEAAPTFLETGIRFEADVVRGQKTGFFLDQRENRRRIGQFAEGRQVLNAFSFSGGFSLYAARGGARSVTDLDISTHALEGARRNFQLNDNLPAIANCPHECIRADVFEWLRRKPDRQFDLIILDPPSLARREVERAGAITAYNRLVTDALPWLAHDGILFAASCSAHVSAEEFLESVRTAVRASGRRFEELKTTGHAPDHPATFPEAQYLKGIYLGVG